MTGDIVNLRQQRKRRALEECRAEAAENRIRFGRTKGEKEQARLEAERAERSHEGHHMLERGKKPESGAEND